MTSIIQDNIQAKRAKLYQDKLDKEARVAKAAIDVAEGLITNLQEGKFFVDDTSTVTVKVTEKLTDIWTDKGLELSKFDAWTW